MNLPVYIGVHWYKGNETDYLDDRLGQKDNDKYFIGNYTYTLKVELATKGDKTWNFEYVQGEPVYHIDATVNGQAATVSARELNPDTKTICVTYVFENIPVGEVTPYVSVGTPVAGKTKDDITLEAYNTRQMRLASWGEDCNWYYRSGSSWIPMESDDKFATGMTYRLIAKFNANDGFRFSASGTHTVGDDGYIYGYVNGKQMSMKLDKYADEFLYHSVTFTYDFTSCEAQELDRVSFSGIQAPVAGQHPIYSVTMGDSTYSLVTDPTVNGGAEYGFVNGISWSDTTYNYLNEDSTFEAGKSYVLSFFIKSDDIYRFTDWVTGSSDVGYASVETMIDNPSLAFVTVEFAPCGGGLMSNLSVGGFREPMNSASPDSNLICGQGYEKHGELKWIEVTDEGEREMNPGDRFVYGNQYKVIMVLKATDSFTLAARDSLSVSVNGKPADLLAGYEDEAESKYVTVVKYFDCAKAPIDEVSVTLDSPLEGNYPAQQIKLNGDTYIVEGFMIADHETNVVLTPDTAYVGAKNYSVTVKITAKHGYSIADGITSAFINGQEANVIAYGVDSVVFTLILMADELPYYGVSFSDGQSLLTKAGMITLPAYEGSLQENEKFVGWTTDGITTFIGEYYVGENLDFTAVIAAEDVHVHVYGNDFIDDGQGMHYRQCIDEDCPYPVSSVIDQGNHQYENMHPCEMECTVCGHVRDGDVGFGYHNYEFACSEVCPTCGETRVTTHTPGAAANCTEAQTCTVCSKVLKDALGHTAGEPANCGHAQTCTVCNAELSPIQGEHIPGAAATCTEPQKCTVCKSELAPANGHVAGVEWMHDGDGHWHICAICNENCDFVEHKDTDGDELCDTCGYDTAGGIGTGAIIAIVLGSVLVLGGGGFCLYWFVIRKKKLSAKE